jgi:RnfABCDGE-type electron transport complex D subunit/RnfABCDGE-type electron transport complex G subunit
MNHLVNVSSSPHVRSPLTTGKVMYDVILALMPVTFFGVWHFGVHALLIILMSVASAVITEFVFDYIAHRPNTLSDGSAIVTGLLLGLVLPPTVPLYVPFAGSLFAILFAKCCFGGLGQNFMNPALAGRCFLLISFGTVMNDYAVDGMSSATPLAVLGEGGTVNISDMFMGFATGTIAVSIAAMLLGGAFLLITGGITWEIPVSYLASFVVVMAIAGGQGLDPLFLLAHLCGGGVVFGAIFMATDPVTSPMTSRGQLIYGAVIGILTAVFRIMGSAADSVSFAIILGNVVTPLIDRIPLPQPFGISVGGPAAQKEKKGFQIPKAAVVLAAITLIAGIALGGVNALTAPAIAAQEAAAAAEAYVAVLPDAESIEVADDAVTEAVAASAGTYGKSTIQEVMVGKDASGNVVGYGISVNNTEGFDGSITLSVGISSDGTVTGISFTELHETAGMGMRADEDDFKSQFVGVNVSSFTLNKKGGSTADDEIDSISGASITSNAVVNAVNAALDFFASNLQ